jgi:P2-related tail formation protein
MEMQELEITIDNEGRVQIGAKGIHGGECVTVTRSLEEAIGEVRDRTFTSEFYDETCSENRLTTRKTW